MKSVNSTATEILSSGHFIFVNSISVLPSSFFTDHTKQCDKLTNLKPVNTVYATKCNRVCKVY